MFKSDNKKEKYIYILFSFWLKVLEGHIEYHHIAHPPLKGPKMVKIILLFFFLKFVFKYDFIGCFELVFRGK